jgi:hypothetical protein
MGVYNPPIIPPNPPPKWYETNPFWGGIGICLGLIALGFSMTGRVVLAHIFFMAAWPFGSIALWVFCKGVFRRKKLAWMLTSIFLAIVLVGMDFIALHKGADAHSESTGRAQSAPSATAPPPQLATNQQTPADHTHQSESKPQPKTSREAEKKKQETIQSGSGNQQAAAGDKSLVQQNSGGVNVQQGTTGDNSPITNSPITIGNVPKDISDKEMASLVDYLSSAPQKVPIFINADQISGTVPFPDKFYDALNSAGWPMIRPGVDRMTGFGPPGKPFRGAVVAVKGEPLKPGETVNTGPSDPLTYIGKALDRFKIPIILKREPNQTEGQIAIVFEGGFPN